MPTQVPKLISTAEAAKALHVTTRSIQRWAGEGLIPAMKLPGHTGAYVFTPEAIEAAQRFGIYRDDVPVLQPTRAWIGDAS